MKIMTIMGTRPEIIRLSRIIEKLDNLVDHVLVHTGQNFDLNLKDFFFSDLKVRTPDYYLGIQEPSFGKSIGKIISNSEDILIKEKPDKLLVLGDTDSALSAIVAKRLGIPVYHMEAGNRCYDDRVPEEVNRRIIDHCSDMLLPYTEISKNNLIREGIQARRIHVTGNPIYEVVRHFEQEIESSQILEDMGLTKNKYFLITMHRAENVDIAQRLVTFVKTFDRLQEKFNTPVIVSTHPRTRKRIKEFNIALDNPQVHYIEPLGFFDFVNMEKNAHCILSDSGTVQEECCIFKVPNVTIRDVTERPETLSCGSNILSGANQNQIEQCVDTVLSRKCEWNPPPEYLAENVSDTVIKILMSIY